MINQTKNTKIMAEQQYDFQNAHKNSFNVTAIFLNYGFIYTFVYIFSDSQLQEA